MKQADLILQLKSLKSIKPDSSILMSLEKDIHSRLEIDEGNSVWEKMKSFASNIFLTFKTNPFASYGIATALLVVVLLSISTGFLPNGINKTLLYAKIATAPNQYIKASIALSYAQDKINNVRVSSNKLSEDKIKDISQSIAFANVELSGLKLMGEKGKYTSEQCKELYRSYHASLENLDSNITTSFPNEKDKQSIASLKTQISNYENQAEQKLKIY